MGIRRIAKLSGAVITLACKREHAVAVASGRPGTEEPGTRWRIIDSAAVGVWWDPMIDSATVYRIRVQRAGDSVDIADVIGPLPQVIGGDTIVGLRLRRIGEEAAREWFRVALPSHDAATLPLPTDVFSNFTDVSLAPDGRHIAYVADAGDATPQAVVRRFPAGPVVVRGPRAAGCECDVDLNHARWVSADSFEVAVVNRAASADHAPAWLITVGRVSPPHQRTVGVASEPTWHEAPPR